MSSVKTRIGGKSSPLGFEVEVFAGKKYSARFYFKTSKYIPETHIGAPYGLFEILMLVIWIFTTVAWYVAIRKFSPAYDIPLIIGAVWALFFARSVSTIAELKWAITNRFLKTGLARWHGCEHKLISLLYSGEDITYENFKKMPRVAINCGSIFAGIRIMAPFVVAAPSISIFKPLLGILAFLFTLFIALSLHLILQYLWLTCEPNDGQIYEALELGKNARDALKNSI